jgi:hypothetical protein
MEVAAWTLIIVVLMAVFKVLKFERTEAVYYEKQLLKRYLEIKKINPNYRVKYLKEWETSVMEALENKNKKRALKIVKLNSFSRTR